MTDQQPGAGVSSDNACTSFVTKSMVADLSPRDVLDFVNSLILDNKLLRERLADCNQRLKSPHSHTLDPQPTGHSHPPEEETTQDPSRSLPTRPAYPVTDNVTTGNDPTTGHYLSTLDDGRSATVQPEQVQPTYYEVEMVRVRSTLEECVALKAENSRLLVLLDQQKSRMSTLCTERNTLQDERNTLQDALRKVQNDLRSMQNQRDIAYNQLSESGSELAKIASLRVQLETKERTAKELADQVNELKQADLASSRKIGELQKQNEELERRNMTLISELSSQHQQVDSLKLQLVEQQAAQSATSEAEKDKLQSAINQLETENRRLLHNLQEQKFNKVQKQVAEIKDLKEENERLQALARQRDAEKSRELSSAKEQLVVLTAENERLRAGNSTWLQAVKLEEQRYAESSRELSSAKEQLVTLTAERERLRAGNGALHESLRQHEDKSLRELSSLKEQLEAQRAENKRLLADRSSLDGSLRQEEQRCAESWRELSSVKEQLEAQRVEIERLRADKLATASQADQSADTKRIKELTRANNDLVLERDRLLRNRESLLSMLSDPKTNKSDVEMRGQLDELRGLLTATEELAKKRGDTIADLNRQLQQRVERSEVVVGLKAKLTALERSLVEEREARAEESNKSQALGERVSELQAQLGQTTAELETLQLEDFRHRHGNPTAVSPTTAAAATIGPLHGPASGGDPGYPFGAAAAAAAQSHLDTRPPNQRLPPAGQQWAPLRQQSPRGGPAAPYRLQRPGRAAGAIVCPYCNSDMPDFDSRFVHMKDCPRRPAEDDS